MSEELATQKQETAIAHSTRRGHEAPPAEEDLIIPRALLIQNTPPKTVPIDRKVIHPGMIINSITAQELPKDAEGGITFIPFRRSKNWVKFNAQDKDKPDFDPQYEPGQMIWRSEDPSDPKVVEESKFGPNGEPPKATAFINYFCHVPGSMPIVISFAKTSYKAGKKLTTMTQFKDGDLFSWKYRLKSAEEKNAEKQSYYVLTVEDAGKASDEDFKIAEKLWNQFGTKEVKVHDLEPEETTGGEDKKQQPWDKPSTQQ